MVSPNDDGYELNRIMMRFDSIDRSHRERFDSIDSLIDKVVARQDIANGRQGATEEAVRDIITDAKVMQAYAQGAGDTNEANGKHNDRVRRAELAVVGLIISVFAILLPIAANAIWGA